MAAIGFLGSSFFLVTLIFSVKTSTVPHSVLLVNGSLSVLSKLGLMVLGVFFIRRDPCVRVAAAVGFALSMIDSVYFRTAVWPAMQLPAHPTLARASNVGAWISAALALLLYAGILNYLGQKGSRREFWRIDA